MAAKSYDVIVIGGGPAGYVAAIRLGQLGLHTLSVEREAYGGVCLNWGCIPSKALITAASQWERLWHAQAMGISVADASFDLARTQEWKAGIVKQLTSGVEGLVRSNGAEVVHGTARLTGAAEVEVTTGDGERQRFGARRAILVATGATPMQIPGFAFDGERILSAREAVSLTERPERLLVIGGGVIGVELGTMFAKLGSELTVVEMTDGLLPGTDRDLVRVVEGRLRKRGARILTGARATGWKPAGRGISVEVEVDGRMEQVEADRVLVAVGFRPNSEGLGLEEVGVRLDGRGHIQVDDRFRSSVPGVLAIGDVTGGPYLAHKAFREAEIAAEVVAGHNVRRDWLALPSVIFSDPEIATVGIGEQAAKAEGREVSVGRFPFSALGRAMSLGETDGFVKVVADRERVVGVSIVGPEASELISEATFAMEMMAAPEDVGLTIHAHPTLSEAVHEAMKHAVGEAVHIMNRKSTRAPHAVAAA